MSLDGADFLTACSMHRIAPGRFIIQWIGPHYANPTGWCSEAAYAPEHEQAMLFRGFTDGAPNLVMVADPTDGAGRLYVYLADTQMPWRRSRLFAERSFEARVPVGPSPAGTAVVTLRDLGGHHATQTRTLSGGGGAEAGPRWTRWGRLFQQDVEPHRLVGPGDDSEQKSIGLTAGSMKLRRHIELGPVPDRAPPATADRVAAAAASSSPPITMISCGSGYEVVVCPTLSVIGQDTAAPAMPASSFAGEPVAAAATAWRQRAVERCVTEPSLVSGAGLFLKVLAAQLARLSGDDDKNTGISFGAAPLRDAGIVLKGSDGAAEWQLWWSQVQASWVTALILLIAGASRKVAAAEFASLESGSAARGRRRRKSSTSSPSTASSAAGSSSSSSSSSSSASASSAFAAKELRVRRPGDAEAAFAKMDELYGGLEGFLRRGAGLADPDIATIRAALLVEWKHSPTSDDEGSEQAAATAKAAVAVGPRGGRHRIIEVPADTAIDEGLRAKM